MGLIDSFYFVAYGIVAFAGRLRLRNRKAWRKFAEVSREKQERGRYVSCARGFRPTPPPSPTRAALCQHHRPVQHSATGVASPSPTRRPSEPAAYATSVATGSASLRTSRSLAFVLRTRQLPPLRKPARKTDTVDKWRGRCRLPRPRYLWAVLCIRLSCRRSGGTADTGIGCCGGHLCPATRVSGATLDSVSLGSRKRSGRTTATNSAKNFATLGSSARVLMRFYIFGAVLLLRRHCFEESAGVKFQAKLYE